MISGLDDGKSSQIPVFLLTSPALGSQKKHIKKKHLLGWEFLSKHREIILAAADVRTKIVKLGSKSYLGKSLVHRPLYPNGPFDFDGFFFNVTH